MQNIRVLKLDLSGSVTWQYEGVLLERAPHRIVIQAYFDKADFPLLDVVLKKGDRFVETYFDDRGYNVFEIYDRDDAKLKGWYCNLSRPAEIGIESVSWVDLALDLWVWPDGRTTVLDEDEFAALPLAQAERQQAKRDLLDLQQRFRRTRPSA